MPIAVSTLAPKVSELAQLDDLAASIEDTARDERLLARAVRRLRSGRAKGRSWDELLTDEPQPGALALVGRVLSRLTRTSGELRHTLAAGLRAQGASIGAIAERFGVSRQRVSALLRRGDR
ncbi:MAG: hypothetical protein M3N98_06540 [Actinomycetota bacterium]|nr:hypothetical protein [Actinomycetota bacterium]